MKQIDYDNLADKLIEEYPVEDNPAIYSLYTEMLNHLMKVFKLKHSTALKLLHKIEEQLGIHLIRSNELTAMKLLNVTKGNDNKRYFRILYWTTKLPLEILDAIIKTHGDVNKRLVKEYLHKNGQITDEKMRQYKYAQEYYRKNRDELCRKRQYRQQKKLLKRNK